MHVNHVKFLIGIILTIHKAVIEIHNGGDKIDLEHVKCESHKSALGCIEACEW